MPWQNTKNKYSPKSNITKVGVKLTDLERLKEAFKYNKSLYDFYINRKIVYKNYLVYYVRSMRINEFLDLLDHMETPWDIIEESISI